MGYNPWGHRGVRHDLASEHARAHTHTHTHTQAQLGDGASVGLVAPGLSEVRR